MFELIPDENKQIKLFFSKLLKIPFLSRNTEH